MTKEWEEYGEYDYSVYAKDFESIETKMYSYMNEEGLFSKLMSEGTTTIIDSGVITNIEVESESIKEFFEDHVSKVNRMTKALGAKEQIDVNEFVSYVTFQLMGVVASNIRELKSMDKRPDPFGRLFK